MKKITVLNVYGAKNIGDQAILSVFLDILKESAKENISLNLLIEDVKTTYSGISNSIEIRNHILPYGFAISGNKNKISYVIRLIRFVYMVIVSGILFWSSKLTPRILPKKGTFSYIKAIYEADMVFGMGGGYFITKSKILDYFGLILTLLPIWFAKGYKKKIVFLPISVGPFASKIHEELTLNALSNTQVMCREKISFRLIAKYANKLNIKATVFPDLALFCTYHPISKKAFKENYIVITAREWMHEAKQSMYENAITNLIEYAWKKYGLKTVFITMSNNPYEDDDNWIARRIFNALVDKTIMTVFNPKSFSEVQDKIRNAKVAVCTRMHSAILAFTVLTPFLLIGYGHKSKGVIVEMDLSELYEDIEKINEIVLINSFKKLIEPKKYITYVKRMADYSIYISKMEDELIKLIASSLY